MFDKLRLDEKQSEMLINGIQKAIMDSFDTDESRGDYMGKAHGRTIAETKRRFKICQDWVLILRMEKNFSLQRICDTLPRLLRNVLDGKDVSCITDSCIWTP